MVENEVSVNRFGGWHFEKKINISQISIALVALIISLSAFWVSYGVAHGQSNLEIKYSAGDKANFYFYNGSSMGFELIVVNNGFGGTVYNIEPLACQYPETCISNNSNPIVKVKYNDDEDFHQILRPDLKSIPAKSAHLIQIVIENVSLDEMPNSTQILVRDVRNNDHLWKTFKQFPFSF